jgi:hypothetical protein
VRTGRPAVPLLELVEERRFDAKNKRHRAKVLGDDSLLEYVRGNGDASARLRMLAECQERYRRTVRLLHGDGVGGTAVRGGSLPTGRRGGAAYAGRSLKSGRQPAPERLGQRSAVAACRTSQGWRRASPRGANPVRPVLSLSGSRLRLDLAARPAATIRTERLARLPRCPDHRLAGQA